MEEIHEGIKYENFLHSTSVYRIIYIYIYQINALLSALLRYILALSKFALSNFSIGPKFMPSTLVDSFIEVLICLFTGFSCRAF